jgi:prepilin-type N-terminal cleavage/methylation domain-containing protein
MNRARRGRTETGMTLIELMVGIAMLALVVSALTTILLSSTHQGSRTARRADVQGGCRQALSLMATELRQAGVDPSIPPVGVVGIMSADSVSVRVRADLNGNGIIQTAEPSEDVTYAYDSGTGVLSRNPGTGATPILSNVTALALTYFDETNAPIVPQPLSATDAARVHSIGVTLTASEGDSNPITLTTRVNLRNR